MHSYAGSLNYTHPKGADMHHPKDRGGPGIG